MMLNNKSLSVPLIQGGMGVGVSLGNLSGNVAKNGGMGVISVANPGFREEDFWKNPKQANLRALRKEIAKAKEISEGNGLIAINAMVAGVQYNELVKTAIDAGADCIISGAGLPTELPILAEGSDVLIAPIVSSSKAAKTICKLWDKRHNRIPDLIIIEGHKAGGHLGFSKEELFNHTAQELDAILAETLEGIAPFEEKHGTRIPVFVAGCVDTAEEIERMMKLGASGVQVATCFILTEECDASQGYKDVLLKATEEDVRIVKSPVGMQGRALYTPLIKRIEKEGRIQPERCTNCLRPCDPVSTPYCITEALIKAHQGNYEEGLFFCGANIGNFNEMSTVENVIKKLFPQWRTV